MSDDDRANLNDEVPEGSTSTKPRPSEPRVDDLPPFRVLLHNDDHNDMLFVVDTLVELTPLNRSRATEVMLEAHVRGVSEVLVSHKERAELYAEQILSKGLVTSVEPVPG